MSQQICLMSQEICLMSQKICPMSQQVRLMSEKMCPMSQQICLISLQIYPMIQQMISPMSQKICQMAATPISNRDFAAHCGSPDGCFPGSNPDFLQRKALRTSQVTMYTVIKAFSCVVLLPVILGIITSTNW